MTFTELDRLSDAVACGMRERRVQIGDRVSIHGQNRWEWIVSYHAALKVGAVVNPVNVMLTGAELRFVLRDCGTRMLICGAGCLEGLDPLDNLPNLAWMVSYEPCPQAETTFADLAATPVPPEFTAYDPEPSSPSTIGYTSGTTGQPKGAVQSHRPSCSTAKAPLGCTVDRT